MTEENRLAAALKAGDTAALEAVVDGYAAYVAAVIRNFSRGALSAEDIDELAADVFVSLWQSRERLSEDRGLRPYLSAIARNAVKNRFRSMPPAAEDISELEIASGFDVARRAELGEAMDCLREGINSLAERDAEMFMRFYFYGEKTSDIARYMNLTEGTVRSKLTRTRQKLKAFMTERGFDHV